jgi:hypothetical protein
MTNRDKLLILVVPAVLVVGGYGFWINSSNGKQTEVSRLQQSVNKAAGTAPPPEQVAAQKMLVQSLNANLRKLEGDLAQEKRDWDAFASQAFNPATRAERVRKLNALLRDQGLTLLGDEPAEGGGGRGDRPSAALEAFGKAVAERSPQTKPKTWRVRLYGRYGSLARALSHLSLREALCVPVGLTMKEWDVNSPAQEWTLIVWI